MTITPQKLYEQQVAEGILKLHPAQHAVIHYLQQVYEQLRQQRYPQPLTYFKRLQQRFWPSPPIRGLYLWGDVGAGKTHLVNLFYNCLSLPKKRQHFHAFMQNIQEQLVQYQGIKNPLQKIAEALARDAIVLVLDEFFVNNIADAMILAQLLEALFKANVCLITTSNSAPDQLYENGLQREYFLPAIELIKQHTRVWQLTTGEDYRLREHSQVSLYYTPLGPETDARLTASFMQLSSSAAVVTEHEQTVQISKRTIKVRQLVDGIIWLDFLTICGRPRAASDYLLLVESFHTFIISDVPVLTQVPLDQLISFIYLIDILYDAHARVLISATAPVEALYPAGRLRQRFERTESRLIEMQSPHYFHHLSSINSI